MDNFENKSGSRGLSFVSLSALFHGAIIAGLAILPALKMLPESKDVAVMDIVGGESAAPAAPAPALPASAAPAPEAPAAPIQPAAKAKPVAKVTPLPAKPVEKVAAAPSAEDSELKEIAKSAKNFAEQSELKRVENVAAEDAGDETKVSEPEAESVNETAAAAAAAAVAKDESKTPADPLPAPTDLAATEKLPATSPLSEVAKSELTAASTPTTAAASNTNSAGAESGASRSYLDLKQVPGNPAPQYPILARRNGWQGEVVLKYFVTSQGAVASVQVEKSSGFPLLDSEAAKSVAKYRYVPGQEGWVSHPVVFNLRGDATPAASRLRATGRTESDR